MAHSNDSRVPYGVVGVPQVGGAFDKFEMHATPKFNLGFKVESADGKVYRYSHFGADVTRGVLVAADLSESSVVDTDNAIIASASAVTTTDGLIGDKYIQITLASVIVDQYAGSTLITTDDAGEGYTYDIVGNTATDDPATGDIRLQLAQPLQVAVTTATDFAIMGNQYNNLEIATTTDVGISGVTCSVMDVSVAKYGWIQTKGRCGILSDGTTVIGGIVTLSDSTSGAVQPIAGGGTDVTDVISEPIVGFCVIAGDSGGAAGIIMNLE